MKSKFTKQSDDNVLIIKGRLKSNKANLYGLFIIVFKNSKNVESFQAIVSSFSDIYDFEPNKSWEEYEKYITERQRQGHLKTSLTASIVDAFKNLSQEPKSLSVLYDHIYNYDYDQADIILYDIIRRIILEKDLTVETTIQEITPEEFKNSRYAGSQPNDENKEPLDEDKSVIIQIKPLVAPVKGKPIYELRIGDKIVICINPVSNKENYYIDLYNLREENGITPMPATVVDIKSTTEDQKSIEIIAEIMPGVYGQFIEEEQQVKLKIYDPKTDKSIDIPPQKKKSPSSGKNNKISSNKSIIITIVLFLIIIILFMLLIFLLW